MRRTLSVQTALLLLFFGLLGPDAAAELADDLMECRQIGNDTQRLVCYDALAGRSDEMAVPAPGAPAGAGAPAKVAAPAPASTPDTVPGRPDAPVVATAPAAAAKPAPAPAERQSPTPAADTANSGFGGELLQSGDDQPDELVSRIVGDYDGWWGNTVFRLENGQVWVQAQAGKKRYKGPPNPTVTIRRRALGSYRLQIEGSNKTVRVKRLE